MQELVFKKCTLVLFFLTIALSLGHVNVFPVESEFHYWGLRQQQEGLGET